MVSEPDCEDRDRRQVDETLDIMCQGTVCGFTNKATYNTLNKPLATQSSVCPIREIGLKCMHVISTIILKIILFA